MFFISKAFFQKKKTRVRKSTPLRMVSFFLILQLLFLSAAPDTSAAAEPESLSWPEGPAITSGGAVLIEAGTGTVLYEKNAEDRFYPASTTKLMTALLAMENAALGETVVVSHDAVYNIDTDSSRLWVDVGEELSMENSLYALMLPSANDLAYAIAEHIGGTMPEFAEMMNERAKSLGCVNSHFENPHGLDADEHYTCPADLAKIMRALIKYPTFLKISGSKNRQIPATNLCSEPRWVLNTHLMIRGSYPYEGVIAGKTGHTDLAGANLVTYAKRGSLGLIAVIMKAPDDTTLYDETAALLDYGFANFSTKNMEREEVNLSDSFPPLFNKEDTIQFLAGSNIIKSEAGYVVLPVNASTADITKQISFSQLTNFAKGRNVIGKIDYYYGTRTVGYADIIYTNNSDAFTLNKDSAVVPDAPEGTGSLTQPAAPSQSAAEESERIDRRPVIIGIIVGSVCFFLGIYLLFVELPYRRKRAAYLERHKK